MTTAPDFTKTLELVRQAQDGDRGALDRLLERYYERVRRIVRIRLGQRLRRRVESGDILQDTFAVAIRKFDRFEMLDEASMINWLATLAEHQISDAASEQNAKRRNPDREIPLDAPAQDSDSGIGFALPAAITQPLDRLSSNEDRELVELCLSELDERYRELIVLKDYVGHSWTAIAEATGRPSPDAARVMYAKAIVELGKNVRRRRPDSSAGQGQSDAGQA